MILSNEYITTPWIGNRDRELHEGIAQTHKNWLIVILILIIKRVISICYQVL